MCYYTKRVESLSTVERLSGTNCGHDGAQEHALPSRPTFPSKSARGAVRPQSSPGPVRIEDEPKAGSLGLVDASICLRIDLCSSS